MAEKKKKKVSRRTEKAPEKHSFEHAWEWWQNAGEDDDDAVEFNAKALRLVVACQEAEERNMSRRCAHRVYSALHSGLNIAHLGLDDNLKQYAQFSIREWEIIRNTARSIIETETSKVGGADSPKPRWQVSGGTFEQRLLASTINGMCEALYDAPVGCFKNYGQMHRHGLRMAGASTGSAAILAWQYRGHVYLELNDTLTFGYWREHPGFGKFTALVLTARLEPDKLAAMFPKHAQKIYDQAEQDPEAVLELESTETPYQRLYTPVYMGWRITCYGKPGIQLIALGDGTKLDLSEFDEEELPVTQFDYEKPIKGDFGEPITQHIYESVMAEQEGLERMKRAVYRSAQIDVVFNRAQLEDETQITENEDIRGIAVTGINPSEAVVALAPRMVNPDNTFFVETMRMAAHETAGVDVGDTSARGSAGTTSGRHEELRAKRHPERHADRTRDYLAWCTSGTARVLMRAYARAARDPEATEDLKVKYRVGQRQREVDVGQLDLDGMDKFTIDVAPASEDVDSPATIMAEVDEAYERGEITASQRLELKQHYDAQMLSAEESESRLWLNNQIQYWLSADDEEVSPDIVDGPEKYLGIDTLRSLLTQCAAAHMRARADGAPRERLQLFRRFMDITLALIQSYEDRVARLSALSQGMSDGPPTTGTATGAAVPGE
jgi:hypothetical protein